MLIRKPYDIGYDRNHGCEIEGKDYTGQYKKYLFIDDLVDTGETRGRVLRTVKEKFKPGSVVIGEYLCNTQRLTMYGP